VRHGGLERSTRGHMRAHARTYGGSTCTYASTRTRAQAYACVLAGAPVRACVRACARVGARARVGVRAYTLKRI
jgi:hypothetical protein